ncbi:SCO2522 family protein [Nocardia sp. BMG111209]|uniref:SCO2522 family protein n=1 Tax=Nocardia sp. BMG111209 TaxID=1160137 RepID=UPI00037E85A7|nr:SCO2522 family protein [Nocardia sp. BMG111209]
MNESAVYSETTDQVRVAGVELSHLSIETGHFYMKDLINGQDAIRAQFRRVARLVDLYVEDAKATFGSAIRVSTCFLIDDYFGPGTNPNAILHKILGIAHECGLRIDYLAREAGCWESPTYTDGIPTGQQIGLAEMISRWVVAEPLENTTGRRPPDVESGWLCNGQRSSDFEATQAMQAAQYRPPEELGRREHSIFLDVEMWNTQVGKDGEELTRWSCPYLAAVWQLLRLGMVRYEGRAVVQPQPWDLVGRPPEPPRGSPEHAEQPQRRPQPWDQDIIWPDTWWEMPAVIQLNPEAKPFAAYRALSILPQDYLKIEHAVRTIVDHVDIDQEVLQLTVERGAGEQIIVPDEVGKRLTHVFLDEVGGGAIAPVRGV